MPPPENNLLPTKSYMLTQSANNFFSVLFAELGNKRFYLEK